MIFAIAPVNAIVLAAKICVLATVWDMFTVQLNPDPAVIIVSLLNPVPFNACPIAIVPLRTLVTVKVVPDIDP